MRFKVCRLFRYSLRTFWKLKQFFSTHTLFIVYSEEHKSHRTLITRSPIGIIFLQNKIKQAKGNNKNICDKRTQRRGRSNWFVIRFKRFSGLLSILTGLLTKEMPWFTVKKVLICWINRLFRKAGIRSWEIQLIDVGIIKTWNSSYFQFV